MIFTREQKQNAYKKLSTEVQNFIIDPETSESVENYLKEIKLFNEQYDSADSEILYAMYGLQSLDAAIENIAKLSNKNVNDLSKLKNDLEDNIFSKMPQSVPDQSVGLDKATEQKIVDIAKKYSLGEEGTEKIISLSVNKIQQKTESTQFLKMMTAELGISDLLAEQILLDLETRVFNYTPKVVEKRVGNSTQNTSRVPEIKPDNLPMVEVGESAKPYTPETRPITPVPKSAEPTQKPYSVPRFGMSQVPPKVQVINMSQNKPTTPQSMMDDKMNMITTNIPPEMQKKENPNPSMPTTKYTSSDPYREPLN